MCAMGLITCMCVGQSAKRSQYHVEDVQRDPLKNPKAPPCLQRNMAQDVIASTIFPPQLFAPQSQQTNSVIRLTALL